MCTVASGWLGSCLPGSGSCTCSLFLFVPLPWPILYLILGLTWTSPPLGNPLCQMELASPSQCWLLPCLSSLENMDVGVEGALRYWLHIRGGVWDPSPTVCVLGLL